MLLGKVSKILTLLISTILILISCTAEKATRRTSILDEKPAEAVVPVDSIFKMKQTLRLRENMVGVINLEGPKGISYLYKCLDGKTVKNWNTPAKEFNQSTRYSHKMVLIKESEAHFLPGKYLCAAVCGLQKKNRFESAAFIVELQKGKTNFYSCETENNKDKVVLKRISNTPQGYVRVQYRALQERKLKIRVGDYFSQ